MKEITIGYKGGSRRVELQIPPQMKMMHRLATAPTPFQMDADSVEWMNETIVMGTDLQKSTVTELGIVTGTSLLVSVMKHWNESIEGSSGDSDITHGFEDKIEGIGINSVGAVDLEDMR